MKYSKNSTKNILIILLFLNVSLSLCAQKAGLESITIRDLKSHMYFLASDELQGRATGEPGLLIAARYLASQAQKIGLQAVDENNDYFQYFAIEETSYDFDASKIIIEQTDAEPVILEENFYVVIPQVSENLSIEGEIVFGGYGINSEKFGYNDLANEDVDGKILMIMNRGPMDEDGLNCQFDDQNWNDMQNVMYKYPYLNSLNPEAILLVLDPKSGMNSLEDINPALPRYFSSSKKIKGENDPYAEFMRAATKLIIIHRNVADELLKNTGTDLKTLQQKIDDSLEPHSFLIPDKKMKIDLHVNSSEFEAPNVFGVIEGIDPVLKNEYVIYTAHYDHIGTDGQGNVYNGADDNASGSVALLETAEAFMNEKNRPKRSMGFLWVAAEEIGLFGSTYYADNPIIPIEKTVTVINLDMVGRSRTPEDVGEVMGDKIDVFGGDSIGVIGGLQSKVLMDINIKTLEEMKMTGDYSHNRTDDPQRYFYRSDQISFARKNIPILFYSTGTHIDYHQVTDTPDRIDYDKFQLVTRLVFKVGYNIGNYKGGIIIDNPFSSWPQNQYFK